MGPIRPLDGLASRKFNTSSFALVVVVCLQLACRPADSPSDAVGEIPQPADFDQLEPAVQELVKQRLETARVHADQAESQGDLGLAYEANGLWLEARQAFENAVALSPNEKGWRLRLALATRELGEFETSLGILQELVADHPSYAPAQYHFGQACLDRGDVDRAALAFERSIQLAPERPEGYVGRADVMLQCNEVDQAIPLLAKAIDLDKRYAAAHYLLGTALQRQGQSKKAADHFRLGQRTKARSLPDEYSQRLEEYAVNLRATIEQGVQAMVSADFAEAAKKFEAALLVDPDNVTVLNNLAGVYVQTGRQNEAYDLLRQALEINDSKHTTHMNLASWLLMTGRPEDALAHCETAVSLAPWVASTHRVRIQILLSMKDMDRARLATVEALKHARQDEHIRQVAQKLNVKLDP